MVAPDTRLRTYLRTFLSDWLARMSGPLSVPFAAAALWSSSHGARILWGCLAVAALVFGSYRVWRKERIDATAKLSAKESELAELRERFATLTAPKRQRLRMTVSAEGDPPSQTFRVVANQPITVSRVDYMLSNETAVAGEGVSHYGEAFDIPVNEGLLTQVWNKPRPDRNNYDFSGPAKIGFTVAVDGEQPDQYVLPVHMEPFWLHGNIGYRKILGSKTFNEPA